MSNNLFYKTISIIGTLGIIVLSSTQVWTTLKKQTDTEAEISKTLMELKQTRKEILNEINSKKSNLLKEFDSLRLGSINELKDNKIEDYYKQSHKLGIVPKNLNKLKNKLFGIECNFEELNGIDFKKGCYVGQENTARIKLKNKLSKRLLPVEIIDGKLDEDETVYSNQIEIGKILINEEYPFALIKFSNENFNKDLTLKSKNASFKIFIPEWLKI